MEFDLRRELKDLRANLTYYKDLIESHSEHVEEAGQKITDARKILQDILDRRDKAPLLIKQTEIRIKAMTTQVSSINFRPEQVDPRLKKIQILRERLRLLEEELRV